MMNLAADIPYFEDGLEEHKLDIWLPEGRDFDTVIWFHGGGLEAGSRKEAPVRGYYTGRGYGFVSAEYRMYPDARFPDYLEDGAAAVAYVIRHIRDYGGSGRVYVTGQSAGAYITMMLCMDHHYLAEQGIDQSQIGGYISDSAQQCCHYHVLRELGLDTRLERIDCHAPLYFVAADNPIRPLLLLYYEEDLPCRPEENKLMYANIRALLPEAAVQIDALPGWHTCNTEDENGEPLIFRKTVDFIEGLKKPSGGPGGSEEK